MHEGREADMKFIHTGDIHLGAAPDTGHPWSETRKSEIWDSFRSLIRDVRDQKADLLLIAGDLFHSQPALPELREVNHLFAQIPATRIVLIAGNHDCILPGSGYPDFPWENNVTGLFDSQCECVRFPDIRTEVYGFSYDRQEIMEPRYDDLKPLNNGFTHILLAHGGDARHIPIHPAVLEQSGFDYIALGHIHKPGAVIPKKAGYCGALEPIDRGDTGSHGYILGEIHGKHVSTKFVPKAKREYRSLVLPCSAGDTTFSVRERLEQQILQCGKEHIYQVILKGSHESGSRFDTRLLLNAGHILEIEDTTVLQYDLNALKQQYRGQIVARYIESFEGHERSLTEEKALQYGLEALLEAGRED